MLAGEKAGLGQWYPFTAFESQNEKPVLVK